ncbi:MAG: UvrD-helicase domain-containing protein [Candidatus Zixiibacteriota bacterium]
MNTLQLITGSAGTGKTTRLIDDAVDWASRSPLDERQSLLFLSRMHGSRRRLVQRLSSLSLDCRYEVSTIDALASSIVNRWRQSKGRDKPVIPCGGAGGFVYSTFGIQATYDEIMGEATEFLSSDTVCDCVKQAYPLMVIDEFQDCVGNQLEFVKALHKQVPMFVAGDSFQSLDGQELAIQWVDTIENGESVVVVDLTTEHRFSSSDITSAAAALRSNVALAQTSPIVSIKPTFAFAVYETMFERNIALLAPRGQSLVTFLKNLSEQRVKRNLPKQSWHNIPSEKSLKSAIVAGLKSKRRRPPADPALGYLESLVLNRVKWEATVRRMSRSDADLIEHCASSVIHQTRAFAPVSTQRLAMTIHTAKNQEFGSVHIVWHIKGLPENKYTAEYKRRLLYNAITRAKSTVKLIIIGTMSEALNDPALELLVALRNNNWKCRRSVSGQ